MKSKLSAAFLFLAVLLVGIGVVAASDYVVDSVQVDDIVAVEGGDAIFVERGQDAVIEAYISGNASVDNVRVKAYLGGYEYDDVEASTETFAVEEGVDYRKVLRLSIPNDLEASDDYTLRVKVFDDDNEIEKSFTLRIKEPRHSLNIQDVIVRPDAEIDAGKSLFVTVRVENLGAKKEEDIKVVASIPELGITAREYIDELTAAEDPNEDEEDSLSSKELLLRIPESAKTGDYDLDVRVEYNRGHSAETQTVKVHVTGVAADDAVVAEKKAETVTSIDSTSKTVEQGAEVSYKLTIANLGSEPVIYSIEVAGEQLFADARVEPGFVTVQPDSTAEFLVTLKAKPDASEGRHSLVAKVKSGNAVVQELSLSADVSKRTVGSSVLGGDVKQAAMIGVVVLVVILVIVGLVIAFSKKGNDEPGAGEGQSYYFYPKY